MRRCCSKRHGSSRFRHLAPRLAPACPVGAPDTRFSVPSASILQSFRASSESPCRSPYPAIAAAVGKPPLEAWDDGAGRRDGSAGDGSARPRLFSGRSRSTPPAARTRRAPSIVSSTSICAMTAPSMPSMLSVVGRANTAAILLDEVCRRWLPALEPLTAAYPFRLVCGSESPYGGVAILSRRPFNSGHSPSCFGGSLAIASVNFGGQPVDLASLVFNLALAVPPGRGDRRSGAGACRPGGIRRSFSATSTPPLGVPPSNASRRPAGSLRSARSAPPGSPLACRRRCGHGSASASITPSPRATLSSTSLRWGRMPAADHLPLLVEFSLLQDGAPDGELDRQTASSLPAFQG